MPTNIMLEIQHLPDFPSFSYIGFEHQNTAKKINQMWKTKSSFFSKPMRSQSGSPSQAFNIWFTVHEDSAVTQNAPG